MSGVDTQMSGGQPSKESTALQQPQGSLEMAQMDKNTSSDPRDAPREDDNPPVAEPKGKELEDRPRTFQEADLVGLSGRPAAQDDSLSIHTTTGEGDSPSPNLVCNITLLLPNGKKYPLLIDEKYLSKRGVEIPGVTDSGKSDPFSVSVYRLKELILRAWRDEWENKPASPSSIRLIHFGKLMDDKMALREYRFSESSPNVVHMSVKPAEMTKDEPAGKNAQPNKTQGRGGCCTVL